MGRIRTIKPEFFQNERLSDLCADAHLLAAGLLTYADDDGYFNAHPGLVKAAVFPLRECSVSIHAMLTDLANIGFLRLGTGEHGRTFGWIVEFLKHQRINRPTPSKIKDLPIDWGDSVITHTQLTEYAVPEQGTGNREKEQGTGNREIVAVPAPAADAAPPCPAEQIVELFNTRCPALPAVRTLTDQRRKAIRARWRESPERQDTAWWANLFTDVSRSTFLTGANDRNWCADFDWLMKPGNLVKVSEGKYLGPSNPLAQFSKLTQANIRAGVEFLNG